MLDSRIHYGKLQYLVKWMGFSDTDNQWLSVEDMEGSQELINFYHNQYPEKPSRTPTRKKRKSKA